MKSTYQKRASLLLSFSLIVTLITHAQSPNAASGSVTYNQTLGSGLDRKGILVFNENESLYYFQRKDRKKPSLESSLVEGNDNTGELTLDVADREGFSYYLNRTTSQFQSRLFNFFASGYEILKEPAPVIDWIIGQETKQIGQYQTQKATGMFRGRLWEVWFAPDIPVGLGPWKLQGLAGLILEARDKEGVFSFAATDIHMPAKVKTDPVAPRTGRVFEGWEAYIRHVKTGADKYVRSVTSRGPGMSATLLLNEGLEKID